ncbi:MAG: PQQ-dependent sugar dehydrogenase, partial [Bacteroidia bacterium]
LQTKDLITNLDTPWEILWGPDDYIWMTERSGKVSRVNPDDGTQELLITISGVTEQSESGLLGMALHPDFINTPHVYLAYTYLKNNAITEKIVRYEYKNNKLENETVLLDNITGNSNHDGCRLVFGPDGKLYISTGDAGNSTNAQNRNSLNGKILRMNADGSVPSDNPFENNYVWATGSRNSQGLVWANEKLYGSEHGPSSDDEVNIYKSGRNYGWPNVVGFCNTTSEQTFCADSNVAEPLYAWTPTLAVCGIDYYKAGNTPISQWQHALLLTSLKASKLTVLYLDDTGEKITKQQDFFTNQFGRLRDVCVSPGGRVFIATSNKDGRGSPDEKDDRIIEIRSSLSISGNSHIYPAPKILQNPAKDFIKFSQVPEKARFEIFDINGKQYFSGEAKKQSMEINCAEWPNGIFIVKCHGDRYITTFKTIVAH